MIKQLHPNQAMTKPVPELVDTHCHIHSADYPLNVEAVIDGAALRGVNQLICVGCSLEDSKRAIDCAQNHHSIWSSIGIHPHESDEYVTNPLLLQKFTALVTHPKVVAIGECGLDYYY